MPVVASHPSFFIHIGSESAPGLPQFFGLDGAPIEITRVVELEHRQWKMLRVDLAIDAGVVFVRLPDPSDRSSYYLDPPSTYFIDPNFTHRSTRVTNVHYERDFTTLQVDSEAIAFRIEHASGVSETQFNAGYVWFEETYEARVVGVYSDRSEELIFEFRASADERAQRAKQDEKVEATQRRSRIAITSERPSGSPGPKPIASTT